MKLYSWNVLHRNKELDRAFEFIKTLDFDVLCLQEVPEKLLSRLATLPYSIVHGIDVDIIGAGTLERLYCVILSKHNIVSSHDFALPELKWPLRSKLFTFMMYPAGWRKMENRRSLWADIELPHIGRTRVFCLHLTLSHPKQVLSEFDSAAKLRQRSIPTIFAGDLNIVESPRVSLINWIHGGPVRDVYRWDQNRTEAERRFASLKLQNPLRGISTHSIARSQLDHILVPSTFKVTKAEVLKDRFGSDHHPVFVECEA
jgi:endonuclease/exonuclease/phosphatase family metal-dependent hydrolase